MGSQSVKNSTNPNRLNQEASATNPFTQNTYINSNPLPAVLLNSSARSFKTSGVIERPQENSQYVNTIFRWNYEGTEVYVTGTFTNWKEHIKLEKNGNEFSAIKQLSKGIHRYKFIVDGEWRFSPDDNNSPDENGNINNIIDISEYSLQTSFQGYHGQSSIGAGFKMLTTPPSLIRGTTTTITSSIDNKKSSVSNDATHILKFFEDEVEFGKEAPAIPSQLLDIYHISEKEKKIQAAWSHENPTSMDIELEENTKKEHWNQNKENHDGIFRALESLNTLSPPSHVILNHVGVSKENNEESYFVYVITERFKAKYVTMKFYTT